MNDMAQMALDSLMKKCIEEEICMSLHQYVVAMDRLGFSNTEEEIDEYLRSRESVGSRKGQ